MNINELREYGEHYGLKTHHVRQVFERMDALEAALRALVSSSDEHTFWDAEDGEYKTRCDYCGATGPADEDAHHDYDCPVIVAIRLLGDGGD